MNNSAAIGNDPRQQAASQSGIFARIFHLCVKIIIWLIFSLAFSIFIEWVGLYFWWAEEGALHSLNMLNSELAYLDDSYTRSILVDNPGALVSQFSDTAYYVLWEFTHLQQFVNWTVSSTTATLPGVHQWLHPFAEVFVATITVTQVFFVRLGILALSTPAYFLFALYGLTDGLMQRDLRKWGVGIESSFIYSHTKRIIAPSIFIIWIVYLSIPISIPPSLIILPAAIFTMLAIAVTAYRFKKHL